MNLQVTKFIKLELNTENQKDVDILRAMACVTIIAMNDAADPMVEMTTPNGKVIVNKSEVKSFCNTLLLASAVND